MKKPLFKVCFASKEAFRNFKLNYRQFLKYLAFTILTLFLISWDLIAIFNFNYLVEVFPTGRLPILSTSLVLSLFYRLNNFNYVLYFILVILVFFLLYLNKNYLEKFLESYRSEMELIDKLNGDRNLMKLPLLYTTLFINSFSIILVWGLSNVIYKYFSRLLVFDINFSLLSFHYFKITLLFLLLIIGPGLGVGTSCYLFWGFKQKNFN